ncbi:TauD/TfdA family dioxygenase [Frankia sp. Cppng1_Ct_nod]|uniref:TauD/TfdA family dioxygenase n=1 Tax=Frankia sp. Cppng1_Ct_nod TaxID=2897162 RepID=UPI0013EF8387|nr:TauD/TfdA family dioxygenase [Frankia sp. Cppng1_Ct_nod]
MITPSSSKADFRELFKAGLDERLVRAGHILVRGFQPSVEGFAALVQCYSSRTTLDPARVFHSTAVQKVDSGHDPIGLHLENGATPFAPDLLWFYCVKAARSGSRTTICDGRRVWDALSERARTLFTAQPVRYSRKVPAELWRRLAAFMIGNGRSAEEVSVTDLYAHANDGAHVTFTELSDGSLHYEYQAYAAHPTKWSTRTAWANSILGPSFNYEAPDIRFSDGSTLPADIVTEYTALTEAVTEEVQWQDGDIVLIDNSRVMHGRRVVTDFDRAILVSQSYARS